MPHEAEQVDEAPPALVLQRGAEPVPHGAVPWVGPGQWSQPWVLADAVGRAGVAVARAGLVGVRAGLAADPWALARGEHPAATGCVSASVERFGAQVYGTDVVVAERQNSAVSARTKTCADCAEEKSRDGATQAASALSAVRTLPASARDFIGCTSRLP